MPDIIITPSSGLIDFFPVSTRVGRIEGSGNTINVLNPSGYVAVSGSGMSINTSAPNALLHAYSSISGATILNLEGTNGSLFSVVDNLSGSLMSVNNNAGLPVFEVFSDDRVVAGRFGQNDFIMTSGGNVGIGTGVPSSKFHVVGISTFNGDVSSTGSFIAGSGSAALPSFEFINDVDTGLFSPTANTFGVSTSGVERLRVDSIGRVGIGTNSPSSKLHILGDLKLDVNTEANNSLIFNNNGSTVVDFTWDWVNEKLDITSLQVNINAENGLIVETDSNIQFNPNGGGNVGIGISSPSSKLQVSGLVTANSGNFTSSLQLNGSGVGLYDTSVFNLGTISGTNAINCGQDRQIQNLTLNGVATTFTTGTGWPSSNSVARETTLNIFSSGNTSVTWTIVNDWYRQPDSPLPSGKHIVLLRSIGSGTMQGHYIGSKTN